MFSREGKFWQYNTLAIFWSGIILILSIMPGQDLPGFKFLGILEIDKIGHAFFYCILCFLTYVGLKKQYRYRSLRLKAEIASVAYAFSYGLILEITQGLFFKHRVFDIFDVLSNSIGIGIGYLMIQYVYFGILEKK